MVLDNLNGVVKHTNGFSTDISSTFKPLLAAQKPPTLLSKFVESHRELEKYKNGQSVKVDGQTLSVAAVAASARYHAVVELDGSSKVKDRVAKSRKVIADKVASGASVYGLSTGFGGSADTRTDRPLLLGHALLQHQHIGILPSSDKPLEVLPLTDPTSSTSMPESWVRGAILIRMNSLIRGHSGVRWELIEKMNELLRANITPVVPLRGSISASGDLSSLSYIAGTLAGNPAIRVFHGPSMFGARKMSPSREALSLHGIEPLPLASKEHLGILNGTAFSASVASLALNEAVHLSLLAQVCTAMGTEALIGTRASHDPFIHAIARPHPGQVECAQNIWNLLEGSKFVQMHEEEVNLDEDRYSLRQDRYPLRTSPQFLGPQIEDILSALTAVTQECNSTTDNPLIDGETGEIHHGGNFQAMAVTNAMEKTRLSLHHIGKLLFAQSTELANPGMNNGLAPSLAATDPSLNYHGKGADIATAAYVAELGYLANPVSSHIQSAEMHNQAINSMALVSARATITSLEVLSILTATYMYLLCQALDLRALQREFIAALEDIVKEELASHFGSFLSRSQQNILFQKLIQAMEHSLDRTTSMDNTDRMHTAAAATTTPLLDFLTSAQFADTSESASSLGSIPAFRAAISSRATIVLDTLRQDYLFGKRGASPASPYLGKTKTVYEFIRVSLGIKMHGAENYNLFVQGLGMEDVSIGQNISLIHEAIRDGKLQPVILSLFV
ncbi:L-Aspartase-like protein [Crucibulum laeve]|uniref:L-Aspartase-like protein n=1 Tax=Crucibulum laeve TaxID=68775 RepID=A0A5C3MK67_9AGAR|nr:L-Aspartase-like protein [Crucibulum laeve]